MMAEGSPVGSWNGGSLLVAAILLLGALLMPLALLRGKSVTLDEVAHIAAGFSYLEMREVVLNPMHPPLVKELCALPLRLLGLQMPVDASTVRERGKDIYYQWRFGTDFLATQGVDRVLAHSRPVAVLLSAGLALVILLWGAELWGPAGGLLALFLYVFDPTIAAHAQLVTTDVPFAFFATLFLYWLRSAIRAPSWARIVRAGMGLGLALATKFSAVVLLPIAVLLLAGASLGAKLGEPRDTTSSALPLRLLFAEGRFDRLLGAAGCFGIMVVAACGVVWATYFFTTDVGFYVRGLGFVEADHSQRYYHFLLGEFSPGSWPSYFLIAWLVKTPLPELAVIVLAAGSFAWGLRTGWLDEAFLLLPLIFLFTGYAQLANPIGVRYLIPCYPFLYLFAGRAALLLRRGLAARAGLTALAAWSVVELAVIWPDPLPYFNQVAGGWRGGTRWLDDSNVDWGQSVVELRDYVERRSIGDFTLCTVGGVDPTPLYPLRARILWIDKLIEPPPGTVILSSHCVARLRAFLDQRYAAGPENWLAHTDPADFVAHTYWVYDVPPARARAPEAQEHGP